jgi:O-antigen/teichoic acid export membrane protein
VLSPWLSQFAFGNREYTLAFIWISITLLLNQLSSGQKALLRGMRRVQYLVKANLAGSILGLIVTVPLYFFFGIDGIVPGIIIASVIALVLSWFFSHKVKIQPVTVDLNASVTEGKEMLTMGFLISLSSTLSLLTAYVIRIYIRSSSGTVGVEQVGLYNAGFALINTYVGLVFTAMTTDFYPRLSAVAHNNQTCKQVINEQAEVAILILAPIIMVFLVFINIIIITLYSQKFTVISEMMYWASLGILFKAASWSIAFILLAKGTSRLYFQNELVSKAYFLVLNLLGYHFMGLTGLGISFMVAYIIYLIQYFFLSKRFEFAFQSAFIKVFSVQLLLAICCLTAIKLLKNPYSSLIGTCLIILSCWYSYRELDKRIELQAILSSYVSRLKRK